MVELERSFLNQSVDLRSICNYSSACHCGIPVGFRGRWAIWESTGSATLRSPSKQSAFLIITGQRSYFARWVITTFVIIHHGVILPAPVFPGVIPLHFRGIKSMSCRSFLSGRNWGIVFARRVLPKQPVPAFSGSSYFNFIHLTSLSKVTASTTGRLLRRPKTVLLAVTIFKFFRKWSTWEYIGSADSKAHQSDSPL